LWLRIGELVHVSTELGEKPSRKGLVEVGAAILASLHTITADYQLLSFSAETSIYVCKTAQMF
jgi:hypothetical protein